MKNTNTESAFSVVQVDVCDYCGIECSGTMDYHHGTQVNFTCSQCDREKYDLAGELEKEQWLSGQW